MGDPDSMFDCKALHCRLSMRCCVVRQSASDMQRTKDRWRGQSTLYPHCVTTQCEQGRGIRKWIDPEAIIKWRGAGPGGRFDAGKRGAVAQLRAKAKQEAEGRLDATPTMDMSPLLTRTGS